MAARAQVGKTQCVQPKSLPGFYLRPDAAKALDRACEKFGKRLIITGALRSYGTQRAIFLDRYEVRWIGNGPYGDVRWWGAKRYVRVRGAAAAVPGTSNHGSGDAIDVKTRRDKSDPSHDVAVVFTSWSDRDRTAFLKAAAEFGWDDDEGRRVGELWHLTYYPAKDKHRGSGGAAPSTKKRKPHRIATIKRGKRTNGAWRVRLWQRFLNEANGAGLKVDGDFGPATERATRQWQRKAGLVADGVVGPKTWLRACYGVKPGRRGARVEVAQRAMGFTGKAVDGVFGAKTAVRAKEVQRWLGVKADAHWGSKTISALLKKG